MNSQEAKHLLEMLRPGGADNPDPRFVEALKLAESDPELARWLAEQGQFDRAFARSLKEVAVPEDLRNTILAQRKIVRPSFAFWREWREWRVPAAAAAAALFVVAALGVWQLAKPVGFAEFRQKLVREAWNSKAHLDYKSTDLARVRQWLAAQGIHAEVSLPAALRDMHVQGCQIVEANGERVPMLCLIEGSKHLHLFVVEGVQLAGLPSQGLPDFERCGFWKTAAWQQGDKTYVLSGLKAHAFVSKFRKAGRWTMGKA